MSAKAEMIGMKFGKLMPIEIHETKRVHMTYKCLCDCGNIVIAKGNSLRSGNTKSCGCIRRPNLIGFKNNHGVVTRKIKNQVWAVLCIYCNKEHEQNQREIRNNARSRECETYKPHNFKDFNAKEHLLLKNYGLNLKEYEEMFNKQSGLCAICGKSSIEEGQSLAVDHCHDTGKIRGLLCKFCNMGLGMFKDKIHLLKNSIAYLEANAF